jgi:carboxylesterase type B
MRKTHAVAAVLLQHAGEWVHWGELAKAGGAMAWRTRISEARRELGMAIENKVTQRPDKTKDSWYRFVPERLF